MPRISLGGSVVCGSGCLDSGGQLTGRELAELSRSLTPMREPGG
jgi:hypothetical protein